MAQNVNSAEVENPWEAGGILHTYTGFFCHSGFRGSCGLRNVVSSLPARLPTYKPLGLLELCPQWGGGCCQNFSPTEGGVLRHIPSTKQALQSPLPKGILGLWKSAGTALSLTHSQRAGPACG